jgi:predicted phosphate transport protein (TIGR00153 family)
MGLRKMAKDSILDNIRVPVVRTIYKSPFEGLNKHSEKIDECVIVLKKCLYAFVDGDFERAKKYAEKVSRIEHEADLIKANTRTHLPKFVFLSVSKSDFLHLLREADSILDYAEDVAVLIAMRDTEVPKSVGKCIKKVMDKVLLTVNAHQRVSHHMNTLVEVSFGGKEREKVKRYIKQIHKYEHDSDLVEREVSKILFNMPPEELDPISVMHLLKIVDRLGMIANKAENAGDRVRAMLAK